ncbi:sensor histidine kinase, partial [Cellulomonas sp.]|uniref:sensor histidine kinase n=1 Tax=Cellulomonas sp. TaxID=40001 RepID=UPI002D4556B0
MFSRLGEASLLPFDADLGEVSLGLAAAGVVLATAALLVGLRTRRQWAAQGRTAGSAHAPGPATAAPDPAAGPGPGAGPAAGPVPDPHAPGPGDLPTAGAAPAGTGPATPDRAPARAAVPPAAGTSAVGPDAASSAAFAVAARRDITLLDRQLGALDELERTETDPDTLQRLFLLDNLAMRLRRGAESLLVLAGSPPARRVRESTAVSDVVRTASSQIESYERVRVDLTDDPPLAAVHVVPLAHLLAELLENATVFSAPDTIVDVLGRCDAEALHLVVRDAGLGLSAEDLARAEATVRAGDRDPASGERLGLAVVGRLAARLGVGVTFAARADAPGTEVTVRLPRALFDVEGPDEVAAEPDDTTVLPEPGYGGLAALSDPASGPLPITPGTPAEEAYVPLVAPGGGDPLVPRQERGAFATDPMPRPAAGAAPDLVDPAPGPRRTAVGPRAADLPPVPDVALPSFDAILSGETPIPGGPRGPGLGAGAAPGHPPDAAPGHPPVGAPVPDPAGSGPHSAAHATGPAPGHPNGRAHGGHAADRAPGRGRGRAARGARASARSAGRAAGRAA